MATPTKKAQRVLKGYYDRFLHSEVSGSVVLLLCTIAALVWANSPWQESYFRLLKSYLGVSWGDFSFKLSLHHWINDGLMVVFFFVVGLEIKRELLVGQLSSFRKAVLPVAAALGGMAVPALFYAALNFSGEGAAGWGIPMATDIAFALGMLAVFGSRAPLSLKVFLTALAIADDLGAVMVIAVFYTETIRTGALLAALGFLVLLLLLIRVGVRRTGLLLVPILGVWGCVFASGVHATVAGILVAMVVPVTGRLEPGVFFKVAQEKISDLRKSGMSKQSVVEDDSQMTALLSIEDAVHKMTPPGLALEHYLHPLQAFFILPVFALANAGLALGGEGAASPWSDPVSLGIILGLTLGKPVGIVLFSWAAVRLRLGSLPEETGWGQILGVGFLAGIGFTMSLFISDLAFATDALEGSAKLGILIASLASAALGFIVLRVSLKRRR